MSEPTDSTDSEDSVSLTPQTALYCFPEYDDRTRYQGVWGKYTVEVKEGAGCGPGNNRFSANTVSRNGDEIKLSFKLVGNQWEGSEVRVVLPDDEMPFVYGKYSFSVKSVEVIESGSVISTVLPQSLVLGLFTWDDTEDFATHENYNHEVDVEISRWNIPGNADAQFLVQPVGSPQMYRFFTGEGDTYDQAPHVYDFVWNPAVVDWSTDAGGGETHSYSTADALVANQINYVQCLPANVEIRLNLWNLFGNVAPVGMNNNQVVEVVIDSFTYTPSDLSAVSEGGTCSLDCHCKSSAQCQSNVCGAASETPSSSITAAPSSSIPEAPSSSITAAPSSSIPEAPSSSITAAPSGVDSLPFPGNASATPSPGNISAIQDVLEISDTNGGRPGLIIGALLCGAVVAALMVFAARIRRIRFGRTPIDDMDKYFDAGVTSIEISLQEHELALQHTDDADDSLL